MFHFESADIAPKILPCPARIWMLRPDPFSRRLVLELRKEEEKEVSFAVVSDAGDSISILDEIQQDNWWTGLEDFREGTVWLHGYEEQGLPLHQGLCGYDSNSGELLWDRPDGVYQGMIKDGIVLTESPHSEKVVLLDIRSGEIKHNFDQNRDPELNQALQDYEDFRTAQMQFPETLHPDSPGFEEWKGRLGVEPFGPLWLAQQGEYSILAWHEGKPEEGFALALAVFQNHDLQLDGWLEEEMKGMNPDPFFIHDSRVIAIRNRTELVLLPLPGNLK